MTNIDDQIRHAVVALGHKADLIAPTNRAGSLGNRALLGARRRQVRRVIIAGSAAVVTASLVAVGTFLLLPTGVRPPSEPILASAPTSESTAAGWFVVRSYADQGRRSVHILNPDTGGYRELPWSRVEDVSPDQRYAVVSKTKPEPVDGRTSYDLAIVNTSTGTTVYEWTAHNVGSARWSPDGKLIATAHIRDTGNMEERQLDSVTLLNVTTGESRELGVDGSVTGVIGWSRDSEAIYFSGSSGMPLTASANLPSASHWTYLQLSLNGTRRLIDTAAPADSSATTSASPSRFIALSVTDPSSTGTWHTVDLWSGKSSGEYRPSAMTRSKVVSASCAQVIDAKHMLLGCSGNRTVLNLDTEAVVKELVLPDGAQDVVVAPLLSKEGTESALTFRLD